jgi:formate C-acetyltransferase
MTDYLKKHENANLPPQILRAGAIAHYLKNKAAVFPDGSLLPGTTGAKLKSAPVYPEFIGLTIWSELNTISTRAKNPQLLSKEDADTLNFDIYPYWINKDILSATKKNHGDTVQTRLLEKIIFFIAGDAGCISHTVPLYERVLVEGLEAIAAEAREKAANNGGSEDFYRAVVIVLEGFLQYTANLAKEARAFAQKQTNPEEKARLLRMAAACENVPAKPAANFYEAAVCIWLCQIAIHAENINMAISPGRLDQVLFPYYKAERDAGTIILEDVFAVVGSLWVKLGDNVNLVPAVSEELFGGAGTAPAVTVGGVDKNGEDAVNDLTYIMLRVTELLKMREPNMNARYHPEKNERRYRNRVAEVIASTKAVPAFHNDIENIKTLTAQGTAIEHARDYAIIGCVELAASGRSYDASSSIILNLAAPLEMALYNGKRAAAGNEPFGPLTGDASTFVSFEQFWEAFTAQCKWLIAQAVELVQMLGEVHTASVTAPLLSALFEGPMEKGRDLTHGGAVYNSSGATHVGFADVADSLNAVKGIFKDGKYTMKELLDGIKTDFKGHEALHQYLLNETMKYGTALETEEGVSRKLVRFLFDTSQAHENYRGGNFRPAYWSMTNHAGQGKITRALPSGRKAGMPFASGITPVSTKNGSITEAFTAVAALGSEYIPGSVALNMKFTDIKTDRDAERLGDLVDVYFISGGQQVQFNVMNRELLREAKARPDRHPDLLVRVSGYSAYFNDLSPTMQDELISRTEYGISDGRAV